MTEQPTLPVAADRRPIAELTAGDTVEAVFLLTSCDLRTTQRGDPYLALELSDRTGRLPGRMWDGAAEARRRISTGDFVQVEGVVESWQSMPQVKVARIESVDPAGVDPSEFLPASRRDPDEMVDELRALVKSIDNAHLRELLGKVFGDTEVMQRFRQAPGGIKLHHATVGGLLEHTLSVARLADAIAAHYPELDRDLLVTGALLHDLGKIWELSWSGGFDYSEEGRLVGHLLLESAWIARLVDETPEFPRSLRSHLLHLLASHHGKREHGAPLEPATPEALALSFIDDLDSKMAAMEVAIADAHGAGEPTAWSRSLGRRVFASRWQDED